MKQHLYHKIGLRLVSLSPQLELFPLSNSYSSYCTSTKVCYKTSCAGYRFISAMRKDYDYYLNPDNSLV